MSRCKFIHLKSPKVLPSKTLFNHWSRMSWDDPTPLFAGLYSLLLSLLSNQWLMDMRDDTWKRETNDQWIQTRNIKQGSGTITIPLGNNTTAALTTTSNGCFDERIQFLIASNGQLQVTWGDTLDLQILWRVSGQLQNLKLSAWVNILVTDSRTSTSINFDCMHSTVWF